MDKSHICMLNDIYGRLLTDKQRQMLRMYYDYDNSLAEISEEYGISRQAARDCITRGVKVITDFENNLHLLEGLKKGNDFVEQIETALLENNNTGVKESLAKLKQLIEEYHGNI